MSMSVSNVNFKGETPYVGENENNKCKTLTVKLDSPSDKVDLSTKNTAENKKPSWGGAVASFFLTGLGQLCQGRTKDGLVDFGTDLGLSALTGAGVAVNAKSIKCEKLGAALAIAGAVGLAVNKVHTIVDAARNGEKTKKAE